MDEDKACTPAPVRSNARWGKNATGGPNRLTTCAPSWPWMLRRCTNEKRAATLQYAPRLVNAEGASVGDLTAEAVLFDELAQTAAFLPRQSGCQADVAGGTG